MESLNWSESSDDLCSSGPFPTSDHDCEQISSNIETNMCEDSWNESVSHSQSSSGCDSGAADQVDEFLSAHFTIALIVTVHR